MARSNKTDTGKTLQSTGKFLDSSARLRPSSVTGLFNIAGTRSYTTGKGDIVSKRQYDKIRRNESLSVGNIQNGKVVAPKGVPVITNERLARVNKVRREVHTAQRQRTAPTTYSQSTIQLSQFMKVTPGELAGSAKDHRTAYNIVTGLKRSESKPGKRTRARLENLTGFDEMFWEDYFDEFDYESES